MKRFQKLLNFAARVLSGGRKFDHISDVLHRLNWFTAEHMHLYHGLNLLKRMIATSEPESIAAVVMFTTVPLETLTTLLRRRLDLKQAGAGSGTQLSQRTMPFPLSFEV